MIRAYCDYWNRALDFRGRTSVGGYWWVVLDNAIVSIVVSVLAALLNLRDQAGVMATLYAYILLIFLPSLSITIRRLRDGGHSWANIFWLFLPIAGSIIMIVHLCHASVDGEAETYRPVQAAPASGGAPVYRSYEPAQAPAEQPARSVTAAAGGVVYQTAAPATPVQPAAPVQTAAPVQPAADTAALERYRAGLNFLNGCGLLIEPNLREFNRITGGRLSDEEISARLATASRSPGGLEELKKSLRTETESAIAALEAGGPAPAATRAAAPAAPAQAAAPVRSAEDDAALARYRAGLNYLSGCGLLIEPKLREFNRITGGRLSDEEISARLSAASRSPGGLEDLKNSLRAETESAIAALEAGGAPERGRQ